MESGPLAWGGRKGYRSGRRTPDTRGRKGTVQSAGLIARSSPKMAGRRAEPRIDYSEWVRRAAQSGCGTDPVTASNPQNETNEANFYENVSTTQEQAPVEVASISDAQSGLDNVVVQPGEIGEPELEELRKSESEIGNPESQNAEWDDCPGGAAAAASSTPDQRNEVQNRHIEANLGDGHLARQQPDEPAVAAELATPDQRDKLRNPNTEPNLGDGHLARQQPDEPAAAAELATPDQPNKLRNRQHRTQSGGRASCPSAA